METKRCFGCQQDLEIEAFNWKDKIKGRRQPRCVQCTRAQVNSHYSRNPAYYLAKAKKRRIQVTFINRQRLWDYLKAHPCVDCGEANPVCLEFDHVQGEKVNNIGNMAMDYEWHTILTEIAKCQVRCANCHRKRTAVVQGWYNTVVR